jgi:hypothetical protein
MEHTLPTRNLNPYDIRKRLDLTGRDDHLINESRELVKIVATMIRNSAANEAAEAWRKGSEERAMAQS